MGFDLQAYLDCQVGLVNSRLESILQEFAPRSAKLHAAMGYSLLSSGKRIRPILTLAAANSAGVAVQQSTVLAAACAVECIHTYSLIHDDLPAMDNDDWRWGKATNHRVFGEGLAILAGDALLTLAFEILTEQLVDVPAPKVLQILHEVGQAAGARGMVGGQAVDILWEKEQQPQDEAAELLHYMHKHKTGALIVAAVRIGGLLANASREQLHALTDYGVALGLGFQITDDLLDIYGNEAKLGKKIGQDIRLGKLTYPAVYGVAAAEERVRQLEREALAALTVFGWQAEPLRALASSLATRER